MKVTYSVGPMQNKTPDMRVFRSIEQDHQAYDASLVQLHAKNTSLWSRSTWKNPVPVTTEQFRLGAQRQIAAVLSGVPELYGQDFSDKRKLLAHLSHMLLDRSVRLLHVQQEADAARTIAMFIRAECIFIMRNKQIPLQTDDHPLMSDYKKKRIEVSTDDGRREFWAVPASREDAQVAEYLVGGNPNLITDTSCTESILRTATPYLMELAPGVVDSPLLSLRQKLRKMAGEQAFFDSKLRLRMIETITDDWMQTYGSGNEIALFDQIESEIEAETGISHIANEDPMKILEICFDQLIAQGVEKPEIRQKILRRRPLLDLVVKLAVETEDEQLLRKTGQFFKVFIKDMKVEHREMGHLGLILSALGVDISMKDYRDYLT